MPKRRIILLDGSSGYDVFRHWLGRLSDAFRGFGEEAQIIPCMMEDDLELGEGDVTFGFNLIRNWSARTAMRRHVVWMVDPPPYHGHLFSHALSRMPVNPERCCVGCVDRNWVSFAQKAYGYSNIFFLPHASSALQATPPGDSGRDLDVVFLGSLQSPEGIMERIQMQAGQNAPLLNELVAQLNQAGSVVSLGQTLLNLTQTLHLPEDKKQIFINVFYPLLDQYFRNQDRIRLLSSITGCTVHVFGQGDWASVNWPDHLVLHEAIPYHEAFDVMRRTKVIINHAPTHTGGAHERIFDALMCGASVMTTPSSYVQEEFGSSCGVGLLQPGGPAGAALKEQLMDSDRPDQVRAGQSIVQSGHLMKHRAEILLERFM
ncbi:MAG: glycosyltransferase [Kiritimatiellae bacterium]|nr:glycosyltransferase [Kiritimatiellia bacterium]MDD4737026.1 glycosyltransferase [Kiritimatiellia bacterium]